MFSFVIYIFFLLKCFFLSHFFLSWIFNFYCRVLGMVYIISILIWFLKYIENILLQSVVSFYLFRGSFTERGAKVHRVAKSWTQLIDLTLHRAKNFNFDEVYLFSFPIMNYTMVSTLRSLCLTLNPGEVSTFFCKSFVALHSAFSI